MRVLFVAITNSIHTARWINQIADEGWDVHLFPPFDLAPHPLLRNVTIHTSIGVTPGTIDPSVKLVCPRPELAGRSAAFQLAELVRALDPDILHSLELQHCGYLVREAREQLGPVFPTWVVSTWGSDLFLYGRLPRHIERIRDVLSWCDFLLCDCNRDVRLAQQLGLRGKPLPVMPAAGGHDLRHLATLRSTLRPSRRRTIALKGYQHWAGRALVGLRALELCKDLLGDYNILITRASADVRLAAELFTASTGVPTEVTDFADHDDLLRALSTCRLHLGLSISDGTPSSLLEAMLVGAFPVQSATAAADEWIEDGRSGLLVPAEDPVAVAAALRRALEGDVLVDEAATLNEAVCRARLNILDIAPQVVELYHDIYQRSPRPTPALRATGLSAGVSVNSPDDASGTPAVQRLWRVARRVFSFGWFRHRARN